MSGIETASLERLLAAEQSAFATRHPRSQERFRAGQEHYLYGSPSHWMRRWAGGFPLFIESARGARSGASMILITSISVLGTRGQCVVTALQQ